MISCSQFVLERIELPPETSWSLNIQHETWGLVLHGDAQIAAITVGNGECIFAQLDRADLCTGTAGLTLLVAYNADQPSDGLLQRKHQKSHPAQLIITRALSARIVSSLTVASGDFEIEGTVQ